MLSYANLVCLCLPLSDWFTPAVLSNLTSSMVEISRQQQIMKQLVANQADSFANQVSDFLSQVANRMNSSLQKKFLSVTTSVAAIEEAVNRSLERINGLEATQFADQVSLCPCSSRSRWSTLLV